MSLVILTHPYCLDLGTKKLELYCKNNGIDLDGGNIIHFPSNRKISLSKEDIEAWDIMSALVNDFSLKKAIEKSFDINDPFGWETWEKGKEITSGYEQLINLFFSMVMSGKKILVIDRIEKNLHALTTKKLICDLTQCTSLSQIIITSYNQFILDTFRGNVIEF